jgi:hypothetical protein
MSTDLMGRKDTATCHRTQAIGYFVVKAALPSYFRGVFLTRIVSLFMRFVLALCLFAVAASTSAQPAPTPTNQRAGQGIYLGIHPHYARLSVPEQTLGGFTVSADPISGGGIGFLLGYEIARGLSAVARPDISVLSVDDGFAGIYTAHLGARLQMRLRDQPLAPYFEIGFGLAGSLGLDDSGATYASRGVALRGGVAFLQGVGRGPVFEVAYVPLESGENGVLEENLLRISIGYVGFSR